MNRLAEYLAKLIAIIIIVICYVTMNQNKDYDIDTHLDDIWMWGKDQTMDPTTFGSDVVDGVDNVMASHINNLRAWASKFIPIIANMASISTTDATHTLTDTDTAFQVFAAVGSTDFKVYLPAESTDNHPFWIANGTTDKAEFYITVLTSSSDVVGGPLTDAYNFRLWIPTGTQWLFDY